MLSSLIMMGLVLFLVAVLVVGIQEQENNHFFDKENTNALRGFWCLIVVLVHIPLLYQNRILLRYSFLEESMLKLELF